MLEIGFEAPRKSARLNAVLITGTSMHAYGTDAGAHNAGQALALHALNRRLARTHTTGLALTCTQHWTSPRIQHWTSPRIHHWTSPRMHKEKDQPSHGESI